MKKIGFIFLIIVFCFTSLIAQIPSPSPIIIQTESSGKDWVDYLLAFIQFLGVVGLGLYVYKTWEIANANRTSAEMSQQSIQLSQKSLELSSAVLAEMKVSRIQEIAPQVVIFVDMPYSNNWVMYLVVKNTGKTMAKDIQFRFEPELMTGFGNKPRRMEIEFLQQGIKSLAPEQEIRTTFDVISNYKEDNLPMTYNVQVSYSSGLQTERTETEHVIDLSMFNGLSVLEKKNEQDLIKAIEKIAKSNESSQRHLRHLSEALSSGIWIRNPEIAYLATDKNTEQWKSIILTKLTEFKMFWKDIYAGNYSRHVTLFVENLQSRLEIFASQILLINANAPTSIPNETRKSLLDISVKIISLSEKQFYADGGQSFEEFNKMGDEIISLIETCIGNLVKESSLSDGK